MKTARVSLVEDNRANVELVPPIPLGRKLTARALWLR